MASNQWIKLKAQALKTSRSHTVRHIKFGTKIRCHTFSKFFSKTVELKMKGLTSITSGEYTGQIL